jgi:hypothetical protein
MATMGQRGKRIKGLLGSGDLPCDLRLVLPGGNIPSTVRASILVSGMTRRMRSSVPICFVIDLNDLTYDGT